MRNESRLGAVLFTGTVAAVLSSVALLCCGRLERGRALATHNGPSQWVYGRAAAFRRGITMRHTLVGYLIHHASSFLWAGVHHALLGGNKRARPFAEHLRSGAAVTVLAHVVDYQVVPKRLQPGFDKHVSRTSLYAAYAAFGLGLAIGSFLFERKIPPRS